MESTIIRDAKGIGGLVGMTRKEPAVMQWILTRHYLGEYSSSFRERSHHRDSKHMDHEQLHPAAMKLDEKHASMMLSHLENNMTHPFRPDDHPDNILINISTGMMATPEVQKSLLTGLDAGEAQMLKFVSTRLSSEGNTSLYCPIKKNKLSTFSDMIKPLESLSKAKQS